MRVSGHAKCTTPGRKERGQSVPPEGGKPEGGKKPGKVDLLIIDDMGLKTLPPKAGEILLELIMRRYENRSTLMTSNRPIEEWGKLFNDVPAATAILDRFLHHAEVIQFAGKSYRLDRAARAQRISGLKAGGNDGV